MILRFVANSEKCRKYTFLGGSAQIITILHRGLSKFITILHGGGVFPIYYNITMGGGSLGTPNLYYVIYGRPLSVATNSTALIFVQNGTRVWRIRAFAILCVFALLPLAILTIVTLVKVTLLWQFVH